MRVLDLTNSFGANPPDIEVFLADIVFKMVNDKVRVYKNKFGPVGTFNLNEVLNGTVLKFWKKNPYVAMLDE